jgi:hypothetical protein
MRVTLEYLRDDPAVPAWIQTLATGAISAAVPPADGATIINHVRAFGPPDPSDEEFEHGWAACNEAIVDLLTDLGFPSPAVAAEPVAAQEEFSTETAVKAICFARDLIEANRKSARPEDWFPSLRALRALLSAPDELTDEISRSWQKLEEHGFPPEASGWPFRSIKGELPNAIDCALTCVIRQRNELSTTPPVRGDREEAKPILDEETANLAAHIWAAGADLETANFVATQLAKKNLRLVPDQVTEAMWQTGRAADEVPGDSYSKIYLAMIRAAPRA